MNNTSRSARHALIATILATGSIASAQVPGGSQFPGTAPMHTSAASPASTSTIAPNVGFSIIKTGTLKVREGLIFSGGDFDKEVDSVFSAVLVQHGNDRFLFDTGLGSNIDQQYRQDMPIHLRLLFSYEKPISPASDQLKQAQLGSISRIVLSHSHWDHASGLTDFPGVPVYVSEKELRDIRQPAGAVGRAWPSQVGDKSIRWATIDFENKPYQGFEQSLDLYKNGSVVFVPMYGHTPGSIGMFLTVDSGKKFFFVGDVVWSAKALDEGRPKMWFARSQVDRDAVLVKETMERIRRAQLGNPGLVVVPAHDGRVMNRLGYFPNWVR